jgi:hypothetical protein
MNHPDLPPLPESDAHGPQVCAIVRLYLAVLDDAPAEQVRLVFEHIHICPACAAELHLFAQATQLVSGAANLEPPPRVDRTVLAAIATWSSPRSPEHVHPLRLHCASRDNHSLRPVGQMAAAVMLLIAILTAYLLTGAAAPTRAFALPANLSWNGYVLFYRETRVGANGTQYRVSCYDDLGTGRMHVETIAGSDLDIVVVGDDQVLLGKDLIHHIAGWDANAWSVDDSIFNLVQLRYDLQARRAVYEGMDRFEGQKVYRIRWKNGLVLLLNTGYWPVNVLRDSHGPGSGQPIYKMLTWLPISQVPSTLWDTQVPAGFHLGRLPAGP